MYYKYRSASNTKKKKKNLNFPEAKNPSTQPTVKINSCPHPSSQVFSISPALPSIKPFSFNISLPLCPCLQDRQN